MLLIVICVLILVAAFRLLRNRRRQPKLISTKGYAVFISGCDSGIGYSLACHCAELGFTVFASCLDLHSLGASNLQQLRNVYVIEMNIRHTNSVINAVSTVNKILCNESLVLEALINNAGVMVFGEFAWFTENIIEQQIGVNLSGAMRITNAFLPLLVKNKGRIINICSHCSLQALPGLSVYAASKSGLLAWSNALRMELKKFGVFVVSFLPGSFPAETNILAKQRQYAEEMKENMSTDDWKLYKNYFLEYNAYLFGFDKPVLKPVTDNYLYSLFNDALLSSVPKPHYSNSPLRYKFYHFLFKITPTSIRDQLVVRFVNMPKWKY